MATELRGASTDQSIRALNPGERCPVMCGAHYSCRKPPVCVTAYTQKTGKALGNNTNHRAARIQYACVDHGGAFADKHGLTFPAIPAAEDVAA